MDLLFQGGPCSGSMLNFIGINLGQRLTRQTLGQAQMRTAQPGKPQHCAPEWKGLGSGKGLLKMLTDDVTAEEKTQRPGKHFRKNVRDGGSEGCRKDVGLRNLCGFTDWYCI